jgi:hypothetical protein
MNRNLSHYGKQTLGLAVCLLLTLLCAAAVAQDVYAEPYLQFGDTITWDTTKDQMFVLENITDKENLDTYEVGDYLQYAFDHQTADGLTDVVYYIFKIDHLAMLGCTISASDLPEGTEITSVLDSQLLKLTEKYGEPTTGDKQQLIALFNALDSSGLTEDDIMSLAGWDLGDGAALYLVNFQDQSITYLYARSTLILNAE